MHKRHSEPLAAPLAALIAALALGLMLTASPGCASGEVGMSLGTPW